MFSSSLLFQTTWTLRRSLLLRLPKPQERKVRSQCPLHRLSCAKMPIGDLDNAALHHLVSARCPFPCAEGHGNQAFGMQRVPDFLGSLVWQRVVPVLVDQQSKFAYGQKGGDEPGAHVDARTLSNRAIRSQGPAFPSSESIGKVLFRPGIVLADVYCPFCALAGIEGSGDELEDAANSDYPTSQVLFPVAGEKSPVVKKRQPFFLGRYSFQVASKTE